MASRFDAAAYNFRKRCPYISKDLLRWFPGHMNKGLKQMQRKLKSVDCIIEVHDARIPFTGRNPIFTKTLTEARPHILVLNKRDLTIQRLMNKVKDRLKAEDNIENVVYTNCKDQFCRGIKTLRPLLVDLIKDSNRFNRSENEELNVMIIGVPNVGKSSLINMLRSRNMKVGHTLPTGAVAGITRSLMTKVRINAKPEIFMYDTPVKVGARGIPARSLQRLLKDLGLPRTAVRTFMERVSRMALTGYSIWLSREGSEHSAGILEPSVINVEMGLKLALCASLLDHLVGEEAIADYLLYWMNKHGMFKYVDYMGLKEPNDDIQKVLLMGAIKYNRIRKVQDFDGSTRQVPDLLETSKMMVKAFRTGELGRTLLDIELIKSDDFEQYHAEM